ncbi:helix-turn-helix domain-containing protein [Photobacterium damselae]|uniref:helix-turn-helix domain-containing protein n=1 Tax=Photobacterium damselae TaxID=38293 RepID=UPI004068EC4B
MSLLNSPLELLTKDPAELSSLSIKTKLMKLITCQIRKNGWTQSQAATNLQVSQPRISNLMNGQISKFSSDMLFEMSYRMGFGIDVDYDLSSNNPISINLNKSAAATTDLE